MALLVQLLDLWWCFCCHSVYGLICKLTLLWLKCGHISDREDKHSMSPSFTWFLQMWVFVNSRIWSQIPSSSLQFHPSHFLHSMNIQSNHSAFTKAWRQAKIPSQITGKKPKLPQRRHEHKHYYSCKSSKDAHCRSRPILGVGVRPVHDNDMSALLFFLTIQINLILLSNPTKTKFTKADTTGPDIQKNKQNGRLMRTPLIGDQLIRD